MRVTNNMMVDQLRRNLFNNQRLMYKKQDQLATGKEIQRASDNPIATAKILKFSTDLSELAQYDRNTSDALSWLEVTESAVYDNVTLLQRARELAVQAANGTNTTEDTQKLSAEIVGLRAQLISNGNMNYAGRYLFSGYETNKKLFNEDGTYNIDVTKFVIENPPVTRYEVGVGTSIDISSNGINIYGYDDIVNAYTTTTPAGSQTGVAATQSRLVGSFTFQNDYTGDTLDITLGGNVYNVDESVLNGSIFPLTKSKVLEAYRNADFGGVRLSTVADVYFDTTDQLVIKAKAFGAVPLVTISTDFTPTYTAGTNTVEAAIVSTTALTDADVAADPTVYENAQMVVVYNGERSKITLFEPPTALPATVAEVVTELNAKLDMAFGAGNIVATEASGIITITTNGSPQNGVAPTLTVEPIRATESTLIRDLNRFVEALTTGDKTYMDTFLGLIDGHMNNILTIQADIGARNNRLELIMNRISDNNITYTRQLSNAQDADMGQVIMQLKNAENVYKSSLSVGARVVQPTLVDFLR